MKRFITAIVALFYFTISSGVVVSTHYCMGKKSSVQLHAFAPAKCACGKKTESRKGCCRTELKLVKVEDAQKASDAIHHFQTPVVVKATQLSLWQAPFCNSSSHVMPDGHSPPLLSEQDTYLRNCVFRI